MKSSCQCASDPKLNHYIHETSIKVVVAAANIAEKMLLDVKWWDRVDMGDKDSLSIFLESSISGQIVLGNDANFSMEGTVSTSFRLDSGEIVHMDGILYVLGLKGI